jgi:two-component system cell cycle sensor histidine kinase/response regulator CckA
MAESPDGMMDPLVLPRRPWLVLVVDDEPVHGLIVEMALQALIIDGVGLEIHTCTSAAEASRCLRERIYALAIVDLCLETPDAGRELIVSLRRDERHRFTPVVLRTGGLDDAGALALVSRLDISDLWQKPECSVDRMRLVATAQILTYAGQVARERALVFTQALLRSLPGALLRLDADGVVQAVDGESPTERFGALVGSDLASHLSEGDVGRFREALAAAVDDGSTRIIGFELAGRRVQGRLTPLYDVHPAPAAPARGAKTAVLILSDRTEHVRLETALDRARQLESVGVVAGGIAHDFNNVLTAVLSIGRAMRSELLPDDPHREDLDVMLDAATRGQSMTRQILEFSRRQSAEPIDVDVAGHVRGLDGFLRRVLPRRVRIISRVPQDAVIARLAPPELDQIVLNLAVNAGHAMPDGGTLTLTIDTPTDGSERVRLMVADTGAGMPEAVRRRVLEPFFTTRQAEGGSGLGLATVARILERRGGTIDVQSVEGKGSTFSLTLPRRGPALPIAAVPGPETPGERTGRDVLLVETAELTRRALEQGLVRDGFRVTAVESAEAAITHLDGDAPVDTLITELLLGQVHGSHLIAEARRRRSDLRVLLIVGDTAAPEIAPGPALGILEKPFGIVQLRDAIERLWSPEGESPPRA